MPLVAFVVNRDTSPNNCAGSQETMLRPPYSSVGARLVICGLMHVWSREMRCVHWPGVKTLVVVHVHICNVQQHSLQHTIPLLKRAVLMHVLMCCDCVVSLLCGR
jgi:hypothetical protein